jgi:carotenoid 1,2-hydratase
MVIPNQNQVASMAVRPDFTGPVPAGGYAWWYVDALSDDGNQGLSIIAFIGSVFSPWYAWARQRGVARAENHVAMNVVLYGERDRSWAMTERGAAALRRTATTLSIGPSAMHWDGATLRVDFDEVTAPLPSRVRGSIVVTPGAVAHHVVSLDGAGHHFWSPIAPGARIEVSLDRPAERWQGNAYFDTNWGDRPLETDFTTWHWCRAKLTDGGTAVLYYVHRRDGGFHPTALRYAPDGGVTAFDPPPEVALPGTFWRLKRTACAAQGHQARLIKTWEDAPFYARSVVATHLLGEDVVATHEALSLDRFDTPWMRLMLPFKAPRALR